MKSLIKAIVVPAVLLVPLVSLAQSNQPLTRAQVKAELIQLENAGYDPVSAGDDNYPANLQAAEARVSAQEAIAQAGAAAYGGTSESGTSQASPAADVKVSTYSPPVVVSH
jgi:hypothetical protein